MTSILLTAAILIILSIATLFKSRRDSSGNFFMSKDFTSTLKGICAIVVVFVHIPEAYQNQLQDAIGSFAYVAVTIFFLFSSYGMLYSSEHNPNYLTHFWRNRLLSLLIPNIIVNLIIYAIGRITNYTGYPLSLLYTINDYVVILLEYCVLFYVVMLLQKRFKKITPLISDIIIITVVVISSLFLYFSKVVNEVSAESGWCYERLGLVWGILVYRFITPLKKWFSVNKFLKTAIFIALSLILGIAYLKFKNIFFLGEYMLKVMLGFVIILALFISTYRWKISNPVTRFLGSVSYEIYLSHGYVMCLIMFLVPQLQSGIYLWATLLATILLSVAFHSISAKIVKAFRSR